MGCVYLVGGGPGDIGLLSVKGLQILQGADCIVYDRLINPALLQEAKENCECIYVGKENHHHTMKQEDINQLLVDKSKQYNCVVRLKGGDVYVFGRGGEEGQYLRSHHVSFEVIPGISSCIAGLAYAGIPITHRGVASGFHVISAHNQLDDISDIDYNALAKSRDTCVFLMGLSKLKEIVQHLIAAGKSLQCPIAIIANATLPQQEVQISTLENIVALHQQHPLPSPALIVVGDVVRLREQLNFFEETPLFHKNIVVPCVGTQPSKLAQMLQHHGANVREVQVSKLVEYKDALDQIDFASYQCIVLSSRHAVNFFMNALKRRRIDLRNLVHIQFAVVGEATKQALENYGIYPQYCPAYYSSEELCAILMDALNQDSKILIPKVKGSDEAWALLQAYAKVHLVPLYENQCVDTNLVSMEWNQVDAIVFTCSSSVIHTLSQSELLKHIHIYSIGKKTSETLQAYGIKKYIESSQASYPSLTDCILKKEGVQHV